MAELTTWWLETVARHRVKPSTYDSYAKFAGYLSDSLGRVAVVEVGAETLTAWQSQLLDQFAPFTVQNCRKVCRQVFTEAVKIGLASVCVPQDQVRAEAMKLAAEIAECSPLGLISTRATMRAGLADRVLAATNHELVEQNKLRATEDFKEGVKATAERRVANFKGR